MPILPGSNHCGVARTENRPVAVTVTAPESMARLVIMTERNYYLSSDSRKESSGPIAARSPQGSAFSLSLSNDLFFTVCLCVKEKRMNVSALFFCGILPSLEKRRDNCYSYLFRKSMPNSSYRS
ncbi:hypothetical protein JTE90_006697 [Oedothorax gibbosus]|uniref:Uncharacterized protein n=1 Tax=Oedothorax gibbosus TaxID=931172 RepID=A0AAV6TV69_9ARAC|nr:hypothetical protein JTE90_006697 [Oedothorax gibbosus]